MKILQLIPDLRIGGAERVVVMLANGLRRSGHDSVVTMIHGAHQELVPTLEIDQRSKLSCLGIRRRSVLKPFGFARDRKRLINLISGLIQEQKPDLVITHLPEEGFWANAGVRRTGIGRYVPFIQNSVFHLNHYPGDPRTLVRKRLIKANLKSASRIVAVSEATRQSVIDWCGVAPDHVMVLRNGVDFKPFVDMPRRSYARNQLSLPAAAPVILGLGRLVSQKDFGTLVRASVHVLKSRPQAIFTIYGEGAERKNLEAQIRKLGVEKSWRLPGIQIEPALCLAAADVFCQPSKHEGFSVAIAEAMAGEAAVVTTNFAGVTEQVVDRVSGLIVPVEDDRRLAGAILELLFNAKLGKRLGRSAREIAMKNFGAGSFIQRFEELMMPLIQGSSVANYK
ncbi:MAG: glycosyltransferase [Planctomycetes bacterium]|nr:glycosyltransferase [Planctomycetota bacterium]